MTNGRRTTNAHRRHGQRRRARREDPPMDFIFMLTRQDMTVEDCLEVFDEIRPLGVRHLGFKDIGVERRTLEGLNRRIKDSGATSYMEVVSTSREDVLRSARCARDIGVDRLMGGTELEDVLEILEGSGIGYYPFPGTPVGHPTKLGGSAEQVERQCREFLARGCPGVDLLAYRATEADPLDLVRAARRGLGSTGRLVIAGSIDSAERIRALATAGADAFTIGSAAFDGAFSPRKGLLRSQLRDILAAADARPEPRAAAG
jgi:hypothetical protein